MSTKLNIALVGPGLIGKALLEQIEMQTSYLHANRKLHLKMIAVADSRRAAVSAGGLTPTESLAALEKGKPTDLPSLTRDLQAAARESGGHVAIVDCTASEAVADQYPAWLAAGMHVVTPNKKLQSGPLGRYRSALDAAAQSGAMYYYEATVGAGLPVIATCKNLVATGDVLLSVEGVFSGTLSFIFNQLSQTKGVPPRFSQVVAAAKAGGFTEPDPREDLAGMDVARKTVILAREFGAQVSLEDFGIESLVPEPLRDQAAVSIDTFMAELPKYDAQLAERLQQAQAKGQVLRYVGRYDGQACTCSVGLQAFEGSHPFAQLKGTDNIIAFTTQRYKDLPLIVRGPGAGAAVTAAGVFGDVLQVASRIPPA